jgi:LacI family transcriptional regulator, repressor for deo operon, udp, cdd, tsx, nupC, and nupG
VPQATFVTPALTTVRQPRGAIGRQAISLLLAEVNGGKAAVQETLLLPELILRGSVTSPREGRQDRAQ